LLFWLTEMKYRTPHEIANNVSRQPSAIELQQAFNRFQLNADAIAVYGEVKNHFDRFLSEVEIAMTARIQRTYAQNPTAMQAALNKLASDMQQLRKRPYFPMTRFGKWTITARDPNTNAVEFFGTYPSQRERDAAVRQVAQKYLGTDIQIGLVPEEAYEFMGLPGPLLDAIKQMPGLTKAQQDWLDDFGMLYAPENSFKKRWLERKGTPGYSLDGFRVFSHYFITGSNYLARVKFKDQLETEIKSLRKTIPQLRDSRKRVMMVDMMQDHFNYMMEGGRDYTKIRAAISLWQLGFSPAAAFVNLTQTPTFTLAYLQGIYGNKNAMQAVLKATGSLKRNITYQPANPQRLAFEAAREELKLQGKLDIGQSAELGAYAEGSNLVTMLAGTRAQRVIRQAATASMWMFQKAEEVNREIAFAASWELANSDPNNAHLRDIERRYTSQITAITSKQYDIGGQQVTLTYEQAIAVVAAKEAIDRTQFVYAPWARPKFLRNKYAGVFLVFFGYLQSALYAFGNNPGMLQLFLIYGALFGLMGLPGAEDADELLKMLSRLGHRFFGADFSVEKNAREFMRHITRDTIFDQVGPDLFLHGISRYGFGLGLLQDGFGAPQFDASANGSLGKIVPGLAEAARGIGNGSTWQDISAALMRDTAGAGFGQLFPLLQFLGSDPFTWDMKKWEKVLPRAAKGISKAYRFYTDEKETTPQGATFMTFDPTDPSDLATIIAQGFGFTPTKLSEKWDMVRAVSDEGKWLQARKLGLLTQLDWAGQRQDKQATAEVLQRIMDFNKEMISKEYLPMTISRKTISQSLKSRGRARARQEVGLPRTNQELGVQQRIQDLYPGASFVKPVK
jgi:hypothetical protein